ncbi:MAG: hypothetical protein M3133_07975 [Actinomycetota bacterium]|nr:hypothetical protein [Actinomycetota bacterium]
MLRRVETEGGGPRFMMLETIREYAAERLGAQPELAAAAYRAHATYFANFAQEQWRDLDGLRRDPALAAMTADVENLRAAWRHWVGQKDLAELNKLVDGLWLLYDAKGWSHATIELTRDLLSVLSSAPSTPENAAQEVMLRTSLARALLAVHGYTREVEKAYEKALELSEANPEVAQLFPVLRGLASFYMARAQLDKEVEIGRDMLRLAQAQDDPVIRVHGHLVVGRCTGFQGDLRGGLEHLDQAIASFESQGYSSRRFLLGPNPAVACLTTSALFLWLLGYPDRALERADRALRLSTDLGHPFTLAFALFHSGYLHVWRREPELAADRARRVLEVAAKHDLPVWTAVGTCLLGAAETGLGSPEEGLGRIRRGLDLYRNLTTPPVFWPLLLYIHAEGCARAGRPADGVDLIDEALEIAGSAPSANHPLAPMLLVLRGDLLLAAQQAPEVDPDGLFQQAFHLAAVVDARMLQLRAAVRLCRLSRDRGDAEEGDAALRAVYETFTEGFETADLLEAKSLLDSTSHPVGRHE